METFSTMMAEHRKRQEKLEREAALWREVWPLLTEWRVKVSRADGPIEHQTLVAFVDCRAG